MAVGVYHEVKQKNFMIFFRLQKSTNFINKIFLFDYKFKF